MGIWIVTLFRVLVGLLIVKTGADLLKGSNALQGFSEHQPLMTGIFLIMLGIYIIFSSVFKQ